MQRTSWVGSAGQDLRHAYRVLRRAPGFVAVAIAMLALGTGASTAVFSVVDGVILRSPFANPEAMAFLLVNRPEGRSAAVPRDAYERLAAAIPPSIVAVGVVTIAPPIVTRVEAPRRTQTECITASMATVLGAAPAMGRWFSAEESRPGAAPVAVISWKFWRGTLGGDPDVIGRIIGLDDVPVTIVGVMPAGFDGPLSRVNRDVWVPYDVSHTTPLFGCRPPGPTVNAMVRVRPGVSMEAGAQALNGAAGTTDLVLESAVEGTIGDLQGPFNALVGAVLAVLLIAFANVTNLGLERLAGRRRELAVRIALGATRGRIIRETIAEHVVVALVGAAAGVGIAFVSFDAMIALLPESLPNRDAVSLNGRVLAAAMMLAVFGGVCSGFASAVYASADSQRGGPAAGDRGHTRGSTVVRRLLVAAELALGVMLMVGALLMVRTFLTLRPSQPGFDPADKHIALVRLPPSTTTADRVAFVQRVGDELRQVPGVRAVAATTSVPMRRSVALLEASVGDATREVYTGAVSANYFDMMRIPVLRGRGFTDDDAAASMGVAVVNEAFVRQRLSAADPLGATVTLRPGTAQSASLRIVGVIGDTRSFGGDTRIRPFVYMPLTQSILGNAFFVVHAQGRAAAELPATLRGIVGQIDRSLLVDEVAPLQEEMDAEVAQPRLGAWLFGVFAGLAVLLAGVGLAATLAWSVAQRRREIGIRLALGARPRDVRTLVVGQMLGLALAGVAAGLFAAGLSTGLLRGWLYGVTPLDPVTFASSGVLMLVVSSIAAYLPARRATRVDPVVTLRADGVG